MTALGQAKAKTPIGETIFLWGKRTYIMGVLNVTSDSFSGDGLDHNIQASIQQALSFQEQGADIIDVGGQSTRPAGAVYGLGAKPVSLHEELDRVIPVVQRLSQILSIPISVDTSKAEVARQAVAAGAAIINDVWALTSEPEMAKTVAKLEVPIVVMHNQRSYTYVNLLSDVITSLRYSVERAAAAGVKPEHIMIDPGIGFGKTTEQSIEILRNLGKIKAALGLPLVVGTSRKSLISAVLGGLPPLDRKEGTAATVALAVAGGADMVRVHDVREMVRVAHMSDAIVRGWPLPI
jgi:dihydropteroate synthase